MECNQCHRNTKKQVNCNECSLKFCNASCMMIHFFNMHNGSKNSIKAPKYSSNALSSDILKPDAHSPKRQAAASKIGSMSSKPSKSISKEEFSNYQITDTLLGSGSYGNVYLCIRLNDQKEFAIKQMKKAIIKEKLGNLIPIKKEIEIHSKLIHPNIIRLFYYYEDDDSYNLIMDLTREGNLFQLLKRKRCFEEKEALNYFVQAASAVYFLHDHNLIHRDIKPENLLLTQDNQLRLCDFGLCNNNSIGNRNTLCGTLEYMAPEILNENSYDKGVDIWSLGVLLYELTNGKTPFKHNLSNQSHTVTFVNKTLSVAYRNLIKKMLWIDPRRRINIKELFDEPLVVEHMKSLATPTEMRSSLKKAIFKSAIRPVMSLKSNHDYSHRMSSNSRNHSNLNCNSSSNIKSNDESSSIGDLSLILKMTSERESYKGKGQGYAQMKQQELTQGPKDQKLIVHQVKLIKKHSRKLSNEIHHNYNTSNLSKYVNRNNDTEKNNVNNDNKAKIAQLTKDIITNSDGLNKHQDRMMQFRQKIASISQMIIDDQSPLSIKSQNNIESSSRTNNNNNNSKKLLTPSIKPNTTKASPTKPQFDIYQYNPSSNTLLDAIKLFDRSKVVQREMILTPEQVNNQKGVIIYK